MSKVLVIDDSPLVRAILCDYLRDLGHEPLAAGTAAEALSLCASEEPDLVIKDLIMQDAETIVFVEVKTRRSEDFALGEESVNYPKQKHLSAAARHFIHINRLHDHPCRFDVVAVAIPDKGKPVIRHWPNAFTLVQ